MVVCEITGLEEMYSEAECKLISIFIFISKYLIYTPALSEITHEKLWALLSIHKSEGADLEGVCATCALRILQEPHQKDLFTHIIVVQTELK